MQALSGFPCLGSSSVHHVRHIEGPPWLGSCSVGTILCSSVPQALDGPASLLSAANAGLWEERGDGDGPTATHDSAVSPCFQGRPAFLHQHFSPQTPSIRLSRVNSSPRPGIAPPSLNSRSQPLHLPGNQRSCPGYVWLRQGLSDAHSV